MIYFKPPVRLLLIALLVKCITPAYGDNTAYHVIAHPATKAESLTLNQLRSVFSLRAKDWPDGTEISLIVLKDNHQTHRSFLRSVLGMLPHQLRRQWDRIIYSGSGQGPIVVNNLDEMMSKVKSLPGSIGYTVEKELNDVQVLKIN